MKKLVLGVAPIKREFLSMDLAKEQKDIFMDVICGIRPDMVEIADINDLCENGIASEYGTIQKIVEKFQHAEIDALFLPFCDFGEESIAAGIASQFHVPTLIWGPRDTVPNTEGSRGRDTQCGIIAATKVLSRMKVAFSYIINSPAESERFIKGFEDFIRTAMVVKTMKNLRIAQIGNRPETFMSVISNEGELLERFGIHIVPISVGTVIHYAEEIVENPSDGFWKYVDEFTHKMDCFMHMDESRIIWCCAMTMAMEKAVKEKDCIAASMECWPRMEELKGLPCASMGELADRGLPVSCEGDINGAVTLAILKACSLGDTSPFFADLTIRHPENDNAELLWHCGPFPYSLRDQAKQTRVNDFKGNWELRKGDITVCRFDGMFGKYSLFAGEGKAVEGPETTDTYVWFETENWEEWEEIFVFGPYIHHVGGVYGNYKRILEEVTKYIGIDFDTPGKGGIKTLGGL